MKEYLYFPGCSVKGAGAPYEASLRVVFRSLDLGLTEIPNWNCCGTTIYFSTDLGTALLLPARNLALAEQAGGLDIVTPCSGCYLALTKAKTMMEEYPEIRARVVEALGREGLSYSGRVAVRHCLEVLLTEVGVDRMRARVTQPLKDLRVAPYYGCMVLRPYAVRDDTHAPRSLEDMVRVAGAEPVDYPHKSRCCGGMLTTSVPSVGLRLVEILLAGAKDAGADVMVTLCPLCQYNLEVYQDRLSASTGKDLRIPVMYFTQMLGLAFGFQDHALGMDQLFRVPPFPCPARVRA